MSKVLRSPHWWVRLGGLVSLTLATIFVLGPLAGRLSDLPDGYGAKQDDSASALASLSKGQPEEQLEQWRTLRAATARDVLIYVPIYLVW